MIKHKEYLCATNRIKVSAALDIMRSTVDGYGMTTRHRASIIQSLHNAEKKLLNSYTISEVKE